MLAVLPSLEKACHVGVLKAELLAAVGLADCTGSVKVMRWMFNLLSIFVNSSLAPVLLPWAS